MHEAPWKPYNLNSQVTIDLDEKLFIYFRKPRLKNLTESKAW